MKKTFRYLLLVVVMAGLFGACGYRNPYVYSGPERSIYVTDWKNRTNILTLDSDIYQSLIKWYQKSGSLRITRDKEGADYILAGEIISVDLPSLTFNASNRASEVTIRLRVRYIMKDLHTGKVIMEQPSEIWTEEYKTSTNAAQTRDNENDALDIIIDELSQKIYQRSLVEFAKP